MVTVTGSTGIVGTRLVFDLLKKGYAVRAVKRRSSDTEFMRRVFRFYDPERGEALFGKIEWAEADLLDIAALEAAFSGADTVYHAAAMVSYRAGDAERMMAVNAEGTANAVNLAAAAGVRKFCHISSVAAVGKPVKGLATEETPWKSRHSRSVYGLTKRIAEREVWRASAEGMPSVIVNPSIILGPAKADQSSGMLLNLLRNGSAFTPKGTAGFTDVRDVSAAALSLTESDISDERFIINAENVAYRDLLKWAAEVFGNTPPRFTAGPVLLEAAWPAAAMMRFLFGKGPQMTKETAHNASAEIAYDNAKVRSATGIDFIPVRESLHYLRGFFAEQAVASR